MNERQRTYLIFWLWYKCLLLPLNDSPTLGHQNGFYYCLLVSDCRSVWANSSCLRSYEDNCSEISCYCSALFSFHMKANCQTPILTFAISHLISPLPSNCLVWRHPHPHPRQISASLPTFAWFFHKEGSVKLVEVQFKVTCHAVPCGQGNFKKAASSFGCVCSLCGKMTQGALKDARSDVNEVTFLNSLEWLLQLGKWAFLPIEQYLESSKPGAALFSCC